MNTVRHYDLTPAQRERDTERIAALCAANADYKMWEPYLIGAAVAALCLVAWYAVPVLWKAVAS